MSFVHCLYHVFFVVASSLNSDEMPLGSSWADDAVELAANVCNANPSACLLVMEPVTHSNVIQEAIVKKTRLVQDKIMMSPGLFSSMMI